MKEKSRTEIAIEELIQERKLYDPEYAWDGTPDGNWIGILDMAIRAIKKMDPALPVQINEHICCRDCGTILYSRDNYCPGCGRAIKK